MESKLSVKEIIDKYAGLISEKELEIIKEAAYGLKEKSEVHRFLHDSGLHTDACTTVSIHRTKEGAMLAIRVVLKNKKKAATIK